MRSEDLKPYRKGFDHSYCIGTQPVLELLWQRPQVARALLVHPRGERSASVAEAVARAERLKLPVRVSERQVRRLARHDGVYVIAAFDKYSEQLDPMRDHLVLSEPSDFGNLGSILRTALGFGFEDVAVVGAAADDFHPRTVRGSMGARFSVRVERFQRFGDYRRRHARRCYPFVARNGTPLASTDFVSPLTLVFGPEGEGLSDDVIRCGQPVTIPQRSSIDSFNLAVAVGVALYEVGRR